MNTKKLLSKIVENDISRKKLAEICNVSYPTLWRKMKTEGFSITEMKKIINALNLTDVEIKEIFFND